MCTTNIFTYVHPDGRKETVRQPSLCPNSHRGKPCADNVLFQLPSQFVGAASAPAGVSYMGSQLPPTPSYTPRSSTPNYRSGDESDRSHHSGSSSKSKRRASGIYVSVNGQKVVDLNHNRERRSRERIVLVDGPPTPRTPPQTYAGPRTAPPSPSMPFIVDAPAPRESSSRRPVIVDERPRVKVELVDPTASRHARHSSESSRDSRHSHRSSHAEEEERQRRRERRRAEREREEQELREQKLRARIAKANREINSRPAAPMPPPPPRRSQTFTRPVVEVANPDVELADAVRRMRIDQARRSAEREEEAQRQRLLERIQPKRRATVGPGSRRTRVLYDDGVYRWE